MTLGCASSFSVTLMMRPTTCSFQANSSLTTSRGMRMASSTEADRETQRLTALRVSAAD